MFVLLIFAVRAIFLQIATPSLRASAYTGVAIRQSKEKTSTFLWRFCVCVTYLPGQSPAKYCRRT